MSAWKLDPVTGARVRVNGRFVRIDGAEEIVQGARVRLRLIRGEVLLDQTAGPRYVGLVFEKGTPPSRIEGELAAELLRVKGITSVDRVVVTPDYANRTATCAIEATGSVETLREALTISDLFPLQTE